jgi:hypothetical protein
LALAVVARVLFTCSILFLCGIGFIVFAFSLGEARESPYCAGTACVGEILLMVVRLALPPLIILFAGWWLSERSITRAKRGLNDNLTLYRLLAGSLILISLFVIVSPFQTPFSLKLFWAYPLLLATVLSGLLVELIRAAAGRTARRRSSRDDPGKEL